MAIGYRSRKVSGSTAIAVDDGIVCGLIRDCCVWQNLLTNGRKCRTREKTIQQQKPTVKELNICTTGTIPVVQIFHHDPHWNIATPYLSLLIEEPFNH